MAEQEKTYPRFTLSQRLEHWVMSLAFAVLAVTGLPQRYALTDWAEWIIVRFGGIESVRLIHRGAAVVFGLVTFYHFVAVAYRIYVLRVRPTMMPTLKDARDMLDVIRYDLGLARRPPKFPRYNFTEKIEYWAVIWGAVLMGLTGFMLWNPIATARFLPGEFIPAAKTAHSAEALLAVLAVLIWHVYWVHIRIFNKAIFTGKVTREQMLEEHAAELEEIEAGITLSPVPREVKRRRERVFLPVATVTGLVASLGLYMFVTMEQTAITTVPPAETAVAFVPATPTPTNTPTSTPTGTPTPLPTPTPPGGVAATTTPEGGAAVLSPGIPHPLEGFEDCLLCHAAEAAVPFPAEHKSYGVNTCLVCHVAQEESPLPAPVKHELEGRDDCLLCHAVDLLPESHQAAAFTSSDCLLCHAP